MMHIRKGFRVGSVCLHPCPPLLLTFTLSSKVHLSSNSRALSSFFYIMILVCMLVTPKKHLERLTRLHLNKILLGSILLKIFRQIQDLLHGK